MNIITIKKKHHQHYQNKDVMYGTVQPYIIGAQGSI